MNFSKLEAIILFILTTGILTPSPRNFDLCLYENLKPEHNMTIFNSHLSIRNSFLLEITVLPISEYGIPEVNAIDKKKEKIPKKNIEIIGDKVIFSIKSFSESHDDMQLSIKQNAKEDYVVYYQFFMKNNFKKPRNCTEEEEEKVTSRCLQLANGKSCRCRIVDGEPQFECEKHFYGDFCRKIAFKGHQEHHYCIQNQPVESNNRQEYITTSKIAEIIKEIPTSTQFHSPSSKDYNSNTTQNYISYLFKFGLCALLFIAASYVIYSLWSKGYVSVSGSE